MMNRFHSSDRSGDWSAAILRVGGVVLCLVLMTAHLHGAAWSLEIGTGNGRTLRPLLGVNAGPYPVGVEGNADLTTKYQDIGVNMVRTHDFYGPLDMAQMYPNHAADPDLAGSYNFTASDVRFQAILDAGLVPYFRLGDSYNNASPPDPADLSNYVQAAVNVVRHYREDLWDGFNSDFPYLEVWNEPGAHFWPGQTVGQFTTFYINVANELRAAFADLKIGGPGWAPSGALAPSGRDDVTGFLDTIVTASAPLDFLSWHIYSDDPQTFVNAAAFYREQLDNRGLTATESHISEWNTSSTGNRRETRILARGAAINTAAWIALQNSDVAVSTFYRGNDTSPDLPTFFGIYRANGNPKKTALAFDLWSDAAAHTVQRDLVKTNGTSETLWALAAEDPVGDIAVLISNLDAAPTSYEVSFNSATGLDISQYRVRVFEVSDSILGIGVSSADPQDILIGGHTVHLVTLSYSGSPCQNGDIDCDGDVDFADFSVLAGNFTGTLTPSTGGKTRGEGDFDGDGDVDFGDFSVLAGNFTGTITAPAIDEAQEGNVHLEIDLTKDGAMTLEPNNADLAGYSIRSPDSQIVPDADGAAAPFMFYLLNAVHEVTAGSVGTTTALLEDLTLDISFAGDSAEAESVVFEYTRFGEVTPVVGIVHVIPEPTTLPLLALGMLMAWRRR